MIMRDGNLIYNPGVLGFSACQINVFTCVLEIRGHGGFRGSGPIT